ncbi:MAG: Ig-like domain-containing protein [Bacteroidales bacterium]|jgi:sialate O-acetylesterase|nr:Ig-like domain-containing protein [Bacteroidales bacterium]
MQLRLKSLFIFFLGLICVEGSSQLKTPLIIQSGMVIQRNHEIPLWGEGNSNKIVKAELNGEADSTTISSDKNWSLSLPAMQAGGPYTLRIESEDEELVYTDVYIGDVWIASGQSNMQWTLKDSDPPDAEIDQNDNQEIRQFIVNRSLQNTPAKDVPSGSIWTPATTAYTGDFTAVGYYFSKYLYAHLDIPIGIINTSYGGTRIESWMSNGMLGYDENDIVFGDGTTWLQPTVAYNAMLHPLRNVPAKGFIWYQGESNSGGNFETILYRNTFKNLITSWREMWNLGDMPFLWVQLPNHNTPNDEDAPASWEGWALVRESQSTALALPNTGEATTIDVGEVSVHPTNKQPVGKRLALVARKVAYGDDTVTYSGPRYKNHRKLADGKVEITFAHEGGGLIAKNSDLNELKWFSIVKQNGTIVRANAVLDSNKVIVWNSSVNDPFAIRYAWEENPIGVNFYNDADLPAAPFYIHVDELDLSIGNYLGENTHIDRGNSTILRWETFGSDSVLLNGIAIDQKSAMRVWPLTDSLFTLKIIDTLNTENVVSKTIKIIVRQPIPAIEISTNNGEILPLDSTLNISASVSTEGGSRIKKVNFFLNEKLKYTDTDSPYEFKWTADEVGEFNISGTVYNEQDDSTESNSISFIVRKLDFVKYEAEDATIKPNGLRRSSELASGGLYMDLMYDWTLTFDSVFVDTSENHLLNIRYLLNHGSPKAQNLLVNDSLIETLMFIAPDLSSWQDMNTTIPLDSGINRIVIQGVWDYMSFDYISVGTRHSEVVTDTSTIDTTGIGPAYNFNQLNLKNYPNPFTGKTTIEFTLPESDHVSMKVFDINGSEKMILVDRILVGGTHKIPFKFGVNDRGIYFLQMRYKNIVVVRKLVRM